MNAFAMIAAAVAAVLPCGALAAEEAMTKESYKAEADRIDLGYDAAKQRCESLAGNAGDICRAEAKADQRTARAELDARREPSPRAEYDAAKVRAEGAYEVAKEKCDDLAGNVKDVCIKEAKAARTQAIADAKTERAAAQAGTALRTQGYGEPAQRARERAAEVKEEARQDVDETRMKTAREKCDRYAGDAKERCLHDAEKRPSRPVTEIR